MSSPVWSNGSFNKQSPPSDRGGHVPHCVPAASESRLLKAALLHYTRFQLWEVAKWFPKSPSNFFLVACEVSQLKKNYISLGRLQTQKNHTFQPDEKLDLWSPVSIPTAGNGVSWLKRGERTSRHVGKLSCTIKKLLKLIENI